MELETLIAIPALMLVGSLVYFLILSTKLVSEDHYSKNKEKCLKNKSKIGEVELLNGLFLGSIIIVFIILTPWVVFYIRSGARLSFIIDFMTTLFVLSMLIFSYIYSFFRKKNARKR